MITKYIKGAINITIIPILATILLLGIYKTSIDPKTNIMIITNKKENIYKYELKLPTDAMFNKVHGDIILHYSVYKNQRIIMLDNLTPDDILTEGHQKELTTYKGVMVSKTHADKDIFKINLLNMIEK